jgi:hypothetical protein
MISGATGFIAGVIGGLYLSSLYSDQMSASLRHAIEQQSRLSASGAAETEVPPPRALSQLATVEPLAPASAADPVPKQDSDPTPIPELGPEPGLEPGRNLEQSWSHYAAQATELAPAGSFPWQQCFQRAAASHDIPEALLLAIASGESGFDPAARSNKDAVGLMQIQWPGTGHHLGIYREADLYDPCTNVDAGARYLSELRQAYDNNLHLAIAAYNYGPGRVSVEQVPEGARWYSHYIYQHLQQVLGQPTTESSDLLPLPGNSEGGRQVLMSFNHAHRARDFVEFLKAEVPGLKLQLQAETMGQHEVVLLYANDKERLDALQLLDSAGVGFVNSRSKSTFYL